MGIKDWFANKVRDMRLSSQVSLTNSEIQRATTQENAHVLLYVGLMLKNSADFFPNGTATFDNPFSCSREELLRCYYQHEDVRNLLFEKVYRLSKSGNVPPQPLLDHMFLGVRSMNVVLASLSPALRNGAGRDIAAAMWARLAESHAHMWKTFNVSKKVFELAGDKITLSDEEWMHFATATPRVYLIQESVA